MKKREGRIYCCIGGLLLVLLASPGIAQQPLIQPIGNGEVNWATQVIRATGSGAPNPDAPNIAAARLGAERAAKADALRNILETIKGVRIDSQTLVVNAMTQSDVIRTQVQGIVRGARVVNTRYLSDGAVEVTVEVPLTGPLHPDFITSRILRYPTRSQGGKSRIHRSRIRLPRAEPAPGHGPEGS